MLRILLTWLDRLHARRLARLAASRHLALVTQALFTGSTEAYTLVKDLPRAQDSTRIEWYAD